MHCILDIVRVAFLRALDIGRVAFILALDIGRLDNDIILALDIHR